MNTRLSRTVISAIGGALLMGGTAMAEENGVDWNALKAAIFKEQGRTLKKVAEGHLAAKAHSIAVDQQTHCIYFPIENVNGRAVLRIMEPIAKN